MQEECVFAGMCWPIVKSHYFSHLSWLWQSCFFTRHAMYPGLVDLCRSFSHISAGSPWYINSYGENGFSFHWIAITIFGKWSLVASVSSSAMPVGHSRTEATVPSPRVCVWVNCDTSQALGQHEPKLLPYAGLILSCVPWQVTVSYRKRWLRFRKTKYNL